MTLMIADDGFVHVVAMLPHYGGLQIATQLYHNLKSLTRVGYI